MFCDLRFTAIAIGVFYFDYNETDKEFHMRSDHDFSYPLRVVVEDDKFIIFKVSDERDQNDQTLKQVDKIEFLVEQMR